MRRWIITLLGGFPDFESALEALKKTENIELKNKLLTEAVKRMFNTIGADDILRVDEETGMWFFQGKPLSKEDVMSLKEDARILRASKLWRVLRMDVRYQINKKMYEEGALTMDYIWGKLLLFYDDIVRTRIKNLK